jgi:hypothetical protein
MGRSLTDLRDEAQYLDKDTLTAVKLRNAVRLRVNPSFTLSAAKCEPSGQLTKLSALGKSQDKFQASDHKVNSSSSLLTAKGVSSGQLTSVSALRKSQDKFQVNDPKFIPSSILPVAKGMPSDERTNVSELENSQDTVQSIYPKLKSFHQSLVDDYQRTDVSPFDTLHDQVQANNPKVSSNASVARYTSSDQSTDLSPNVFPADNRPDTLTSSEETWKCFLCGQFAPKKQTNVYSLLDIAPPGTTWKCKLCCQWRT